MSASSFLVDTRKSMVITDPAKFPMNMEKPTKEDYPVDKYPILAYDGANILGTAFGYKSFFEESTKLNIGALNTQKVQCIFTYQSSTLDNLQFALCEDGIYVAYATLPTGVSWARIVDLSADEEDGVRRLWTYAVISNQVYLYQQGAAEFWAIVDPAKYAEAASPSLIAGATRAQVWTNWGCGLISYVPSFLNMEGQIGIFRADNRLGFWDSDRAVAWSSAVAIEDFTPSVTTFAGVTKFADLQGNIVKILGSGDGFIIYGTRSIVNCRPLQGSPEKWEGEAIMSNMGVSFDTQVVAAQPDQIHYCITAAGLLAITNGNPEYIATEVMDYLVENSPLYSLFLVEGRYLFITTGASFPSSVFSSESVLVQDADNNAFRFPKPTYPSVESDPDNYMSEWLAGREAAIQESFKDYEPIVDVDTIAPDNEPLVPCFDIKVFGSTWAETTYSPYTNNNEFFYSKLQAFSYDYVGPTMVEPVVTNNSMYTDDIAPGDFPGEEVVAHLDAAMISFNAQLAYQNAAATAAMASYAVNVFDDYSTPPAGYEPGSGYITEPWPKELFGEKQFFDATASEDLRVKSNECRMKLYVDRERFLRIRTYIEGQETYGGVIGYHPRQYATNWDDLYINWPANTAPVGQYWAYYYQVPADSIYVQEAEAWYLTSYYYTYFQSPGRVFSDSRYPWYVDIWYIDYMLQFHPELVQVIGSITIDTVLAHDAIGKGKRNTDPLTAQFFISSNSDTWWEAEDGIPTMKSYEVADPNGQWFFGPIEPTVPGGDPRYTAYYNKWLVASPNMLEFEAQVVAGNSSSNYHLTGTITHEVDYPEGSADEHIVYELEVSGWGYYPSNGGSFRKTHSRTTASGSCPIPQSYSLTVPNVDNIELPTIPPLDPPNYRSPPVIWDYPDAIPLPDNYALFSKGSLAPYYPTYDAAVVYDLLMTKWGLYSNEFRLLQELAPVNRIDASIMPTIDRGMFAGALTPGGECTIFKDENPDSFITYGKMGFYRHGMSFASGATAHFGKQATGTLIVECSMDGVILDPALSYAVSFEDQRMVFLPFTSRAKWFNIRVEGNFDLVYLELSAEARGRR